MKICCIGCGYVGLVAATCLADMGNDVLSVDIDKNKINNLKKGTIPIYEPGLKDMLDRNARENRIIFSTNIKDGIQKSEVIFILNNPLSSVAANGFAIRPFSILVCALSCLSSSV